MHMVWEERRWLGEGMFSFVSSHKLYLKRKVKELGYHFRK